MKFIKEKKNLRFYQQQQKIDVLAAPSKFKLICRW